MGLCREYIGFREMTLEMGNHMESNMENGMETGFV